MRLIDADELLRRYPECMDLKHKVDDIQTVDIIGTEREYADINDVNGNYKINLELTPLQAQVIVGACDLLNRVHLGQWNNITDEIVWYGKRFQELPFEEKMRRRDKCNELLEQASDALLDFEHTEREGVSYNILQVLRYAMAIHEHPEGGTTVNFRKPMDIDGVGMPKCKVVTDE